MVVEDDMLFSHIYTFNAWFRRWFPKVLLNRRDDFLQHTTKNKKNLKFQKTSDGVYTGSIQVESIRVLRVHYFTGGAIIQKN